MTCCLSKEGTCSELWTPVQSLPSVHLPLLLFYLLQTITFHTIRLILCYSKPVSLTTSLFHWGKVLSLCCAVFGLLATPVWRFLPPAGSITSVSYWGKTCCCDASHLALGVPNKALLHQLSAASSFLAPLPGRLRTSSQGESFTSFLLTFSLLCLFCFV